jgi:RimJ/RimL family protein N-acetyltransferase
MVERFALELEQEGWGLWAVEVVGGEGFVGMVGLHRVNPVLPCAPAVEAAWRIHPAEWRNGYASEAAGAALRHGFSVGGLEEIVAFTTTLNLRSQSVMRRIGMVHDPAGDFDHPSIPVGSPLRRHVLYRSQPVHRVMA